MERMQVDGGTAAVGSPTELAEEVNTDDELEPKIEKRKREERRGRRGAIGDDEDDDLDSPSKRSSRGGDQPLTGRELRELLQLHQREMKESWRVVEDRLGKLENQQRNQSGEISSLAGRTKINERDVMNLKKTVDVNGKKVDDLAEEVKNLKVKLSDGKTGGPNPLAVDPWGDYLQRQQHVPRGNLSGPGGQGSVARGSPNLGPLPQGEGVGDGRPQVVGGDMDVLSDEDRRTLIIGGWLQDTRRATIEEEAQLLLLNPEIKALVDVEKIAVYGPRRSVGMIKFTQREGEHSFEEVKNRMWQVIRATAKLKIPVESAKSMGEERAMWASFVKTRTARVRSSHINMVRRVTIALVSETKDEGAGVLNELHVAPTACDMDWSAGTIWCGVHKLASATHRKPKDAETVLMAGGWVNLDAVGLIAGCSAEVAKAAFEREL